MNYNIFDKTAPKMPKPKKGLKSANYCSYRHKKTSKDMHEPLLPMFFPVLGAHVDDSEFQYSDVK